MKLLPTMSVLQAVHDLQAVQQQLARQHEISRVESSQRLAGQAAATQALQAGDLSCPATLVSGDRWPRFQLHSAVAVVAHDHDLPNLSDVGAPASGAAADAPEKAAQPAVTNATEAAHSDQPRSTAELWAELDRAQRLLGVSSRIGDGVSAGDALEYAHRVSVRCVLMPSSPSLCAGSMFTQCSMRGRSC